MKSISVGIIDYNCGNSLSLRSVLMKLNYKVFITKEINKLKQMDVIILPGVGAFSNAMSDLIKNNLNIFLKEWSNRNKPLIGICLGMQLFADYSDEFERTKGLKIIPGHVVEFKNKEFHIGWNEINTIKRNELFSRFDKELFYFNHSYIFHTDKKNVIGKTENNTKFASIISSKKTVGFQFHPEKSQTVGEKILNETIMNILQ